MEQRVDQLNRVLDNLNSLSTTVETLLLEVKSVLDGDIKHNKKVQQNNKLKEEVEIMKDYLQIIKEHGNLKTQILNCEMENQRNEGDVYNKYHIITQREVRDAVVSNSVTNTLPSPASIPVSAPVAPPVPVSTPVVTQSPVTNNLSYSDSNKKKTLDRNNLVVNTNGFHGELITKILQRRTSISSPISSP